MKPDKSLYPITVSLLENHKLLTHELFAYYKFHKGAFIGLFLLQDVFPDSFIGELYESLDLNERLAIERADGKENGVLSAKRVDGTVIGSLPRAESTLANMLISRGLNLFCFVEAKQFNSGYPEIAVSLYSEEY
ncbi:MAG: hypothetical protein J6R45_06400 [Clostridia bacterium]|nr:hypothetical protein [Clostridia bacterium]MBO5786938.1 hypothetical protein [Clostridia bacterium]